nr:target of rapamycin complex 2 subunit sin1 [Quercus suber]
MSLLLNEDFTLYKLRLGYLNQIHDGVGERLITLDPNVLNEPAFRAAGWLPDTAVIKRCYSPPIPTTGAADYFSQPLRTRGNGLSLTDSPDKGQGGMISGHRGSEDTLGPSALTERERRRRKQGHKIEDDDSSDLSDDSEEEETAAQSVRFAKLPARQPANISPKLGSVLTVEGPEVKVISPSYRPRTSSLGATEAINAANARPRARRDTTTSSEMSSDNEALDPTSPFKRKLPGRPQQPALLAEKIAEEDPNDSELEDEYEEEDVEVADASDLSDEFEGEGDPRVSPELPGIDDAGASEETRAPFQMLPPITPSHNTAKRKISKETLPKLPRLPAGRPVSVLPHASLLSMALKGKSEDVPAGQPFQKYAELSGKAESAPLWIKIYAPFSVTADEPLQVPLRRAKDAEGAVPTVNELIGLALWNYNESKYEPKLTGKDCKIENWELRMVEDGEVDMDFPALVRGRPVTDFTSNNNRPPQRRARDKPWDEFGLVRADISAPVSEEPQPTSIPIRPTPVSEATPAQTEHRPSAPAGMVSSRNPIHGPSFILSQPMVARKDSTNLLDAPQALVNQSTPRTGAAKTISIHFTDPQSFQTTVLPVPTTADTYIAELFDVACVRLRLDKALYVFKVRGTQTVAPSDRTVEALGSNLHLDLVRRRFGAVGDFGLGLSGSPGSSSPNAPLELVPNTPPTGRETKRKKGLGGVLHPLTAQAQKFGMSAATTSLLELTGAGPIGRRYNVLRKLPLSFSATHPRTLVITPEYMQILPSVVPPNNLGGTSTAFPTTVSGHGKVTNVPMSSIVGVKVSRKHPKMVRVLVYREKETKRYDFECSSHAEAEAIVGDIRVGLAEYGGEDRGEED